MSFFTLHTFKRMLKNEEEDIKQIPDSYLASLRVYVSQLIHDMKFVIDSIPTVEHESPQDMIKADNDLESVKNNLPKVERILQKIQDEIQSRSQSRSHRRKREDDDDDSPKKKPTSSSSDEEQTTSDLSGGVKGILGGKRKSRRILKGLQNKKFRKTCRKSTCKRR